MPSEITAAILLGASEFRHIPRFSNPAFQRSKTDLLRYLQAPRPRGLGVPNVAILDLFNSKLEPGGQLRRIGEFLGKLKGDHPDATRNVILHYVGHGYHGGGREMLLALAGSDEKVGDATALRAVWLTRLLNEHPLSFRFFYLLDCCFAGKVLRDGQGDGVTEALVGALRVDQTPRHGSAALCATTPDDYAMAPQGPSPAAQRTRGRTVFADALLEVLSQGHPGLGEGLTLDQIRRQMVGHIKEKHESERDYQIRPYLDSPDQNDLGHRVQLFPNPGFEGRRAEEEEEEKEEHSAEARDEPGRKTRKAADTLHRSAADHAAPAWRRRTTVGLIGAASAVVVAGTFIAIHFSAASSGSSATGSHPASAPGSPYTPPASASFRATPTVSDAPSRPTIKPSAKTDVVQEDDAASDNAGPDHFAEGTGGRPKGLIPPGESIKK